MSRAPAYEREPYRRELEVEVLAVGEADGQAFAVLDDSILYPEGGGQPADHGWLGRTAVVDVQKVEGEIRHVLDGPAPEGKAHLRLAWERRWDHMQQHTAQHLLSALALDQLGWATRSFHLGPETSDIELDVAEPSVADLASLEDAVALEIRRGRPITTRRVPPEQFEQLDVRTRGLPATHSGDIRLVEIEGIDLNTCGGTHLQSTAEVEVVKILRAEPLRGGSRVYWVAGERLRRRLAAHEARNAELRALLDSGDEDLVRITGLKVRQLTEERRRARRLEEEVAEARVERLAASSGPVVEAHFDGADAGFLQRLAHSLLDRAPDKAVLLTAATDKGEFFVVGAGKGSPVEVSGVGPKVAEVLGGRGGGKGSVFQGKAVSLERRDEAVALVRKAVDSTVQG